MVRSSSSPQVHDSGPRLLLIGWDGATPELLERFVAAGKLPTVSKLMNHGAFRRLRSTIPPVTACAWSSFLTGQNPGKHGLFEFVVPRRSTYLFDYTNGGHRRDQQGDLLALLNRAGLKVGCVNVPMTYPPRKVDGFLISGLDAPDEKSGIAHPAQAFEEVCAEQGGYRIDNRHLGAMRTNDDRAAALAEFKRIEALRTDVTLAMLRRIPVDVLILIYNATDQVQHHFWHLMDECHPWFPGEGSEDVARFGSAIEDVYVACDRELARLLEAFPQAGVMLISDHGAGPTSGPRVRLNNLLAQAGLLAWAKPGGDLKTKIVSGADRFLRRTLSAKQKAALSRLMPGARTAIESRGLPAIDWDRTTAFAYEGFTLSPSVWINRQGAFPQGIVEPGEQYEEACRRVTQVLTSALDPQTGQPAIPRVYRAREVYDGAYVDLSPDLILDWWNGRTFTMVRSDPALADGPAVFYPPGPPVSGQDISGIHRRDGILVTGGPMFRTVAHANSLCHSLEAADLIDITPTVLAALDLAVPANMDGQVLPDLAETGARAVLREEFASAVEPHKVLTYTDEERALIERRLAGLGYLDPPSGR